jgi:ferredoxin-NADP reductase
MNPPLTHELSVTLVAKKTIAPGVAELTFASRAGNELPHWEPGAHVDLVLPSGTIRQYSLCGDPEDTRHYTVAVLLDPDSRGGSREVHEELQEGSAVTLRGPRNHFPLGDHEGYLFFAGGIGITPIYAMARQVACAGKPWRLVYGGRSLETMAYLEELERLPGGVLEIVPADTHGLPDIAGALMAAGDVHVYTCGPEPMLRAVEATTARVLGEEAMHFERFGADPNAVIATDTDQPFEVELAVTGTTLHVGADQRLIDVVRTVVPQVPFSCEEGYCGSCETGVLAGIPLHRDSVLTDEERACNDTMMICVGRAKCPKLTLDI